MTEDFKLDDAMRRRVIELAAAQVRVDPATVSEATHFRNDLNYDSLEDVELVMKLEREFGVAIPDDVIDRVHTVGDVMVLLAKLRSAAAAAKAG